MNDGTAVVIGAGIVGLANAWAAARRGYEVTVLERTSRAAGASVRNFGMVWPVGQPHGDRHAIALRSLDLWLELAREAGLWVQTCGSIHLAHREDEWQVLREFAAAAPDLGCFVSLLDRDEVLRRTPAAQPKGLLGGLFSPTEAVVNPRTASAAIAAWLVERYGVRFEFGLTATRIADGEVHTSDGRTWPGWRIVVCGGADFETLFPEIFAASPLVRCKLQMLRTVRQPGDWRLGPHLASGLTLRHYHNFEVCPTLREVKDRIARETPELDQYGIHVMASQNDAGEVILGDSHEYGDEIEPFDKAVIDDLMLRELTKVFQFPTWEIAQRWHGIYAKHPQLPAFEATPLPSVRVLTGTGGAGMTMSFGLADELWNRWTDDESLD